jgi:hypothetical protein
MRSRTHLRTHLQLAALWQSLRHWMRPRGTSAATSPLLAFIAVVLALLLVIVEIDAHQAELESVGLLPNNYPVPAALLGP